MGLENSGKALAPMLCKADQKCHTETMGQFIGQLGTVCINLRGFFVCLFYFALLLLLKGKAYTLSPTFLAPKQTNEANKGYWVLENNFFSTIVR